MRRLLLATACSLAIAAACSSFDGDSDPVAGEEGGVDASGTTDGSSDAGSDGGPEAAADGGACNPKAPFGTARALTELNGPDKDQNARLTPDELNIYFESTRNGGFFFDIYIAVRKSRSDAFSAPQQGGAFNAPFANDQGAWVSADNLRLVFSSERGVGGADLYVTQRTTSASPFEPPRPLGINTTDSDVEPFVDEPRSQLWFASNRDTDGGLFRIHRTDLGPDGSTGDAVRVDLGASPTELEQTPVVSADGLTLYFLSARSGRDFDIWVATRSSPGAAWGTAVEVSEVNTMFDEAPSWVSPDGCRLYFSSNRVGTFDIYVAERGKN